PSTIAKPTRSDRPDGSSRPSAARPGPDWSGITAARARAACWGRRWATALDSPRRGRLLRQLERPEEHDLVLEVDAELLPRSTPRLGHQRDGVGGPGAVGVLDEVRVPRRD